ncbi:MAG: hypothetical protein HY690_18430 [Chloroflexi bacterium]|nr:hypothetical protein [Chloroflexota bacterium]
MPLKVRLVRTEEATPEVRRLLEDIQDSLGIAWPPANFRAYAAYPEAARLFWARSKPSACTEQLLRQALAIVEHAYRRMSESYRPRFNAEQLREWGVSEADLQQIRWELDAFEYGNPQLLILQHALRLAWLGQALPGVGVPQPRRTPSPYRHPEIQMVDPAEAPERVQRLYRSIRATLRLPLVNTDYQALARWPGFLELLWQEVKRERRSDRFRRLAGELARMGEAAALRLPCPLELAPDEIEHVLGRPDELEHMHALLDLFTDLLPDLILNDALFRIGASLGAPVAAPSLAPERR